MINYTKKLNGEIRKIVKGYNAKINRLSNKGVEFKLPEKIKVKDIKEIVTTRKELRKLINDYKKFTKRGSEKKLKKMNNFTITKYEYDKLKRDIKRGTRYLDSELTYFEQTRPEEFGKVMSTTIARMGSSEYENLKGKREYLNVDINKLPYKNFRNWREFATSMNKLENRKKTFKENYIKMLEENLFFYKMDKDKGKKIYNHLLSMSDQEFLNYFRKDKGLQAIIDYYKMIHDIANMTGSIMNDAKVYMEELYSAIVGG